MCSRYQLIKLFHCVFVITNTLVTVDIRPSMSKTMIGQFNIQSDEQPEQIALALH